MSVAASVQLIGPSDKGAVAGDLVMLDGLGIGGHAGIQYIRIVGIFRVLLALFEDPLYGRTCLTVPAGSSLVDAASLVRICAIVAAASSFTATILLKPRPIGLLP